MAQACDAQSLVNGAPCDLACIPTGMQLSVLISLFCQIANVPCDAQSLVANANAACAESCIPPGMQLPVLIYLACQIVTNGSTGGGGGSGAPDYINYSGPPLFNPPNFQNIVVDINGRQWQFFNGGPWI